VRSRTSEPKPFRALEVTIDEVDGSFDRMLRRFVRRTKDDGILVEVQSRRSFKKPSQVRRTAKRVIR
jgi:ribosomal protein S21